MNPQDEPVSNPELESFREQWKAEVRAKVVPRHASSSSSSSAPTRPVRAAAAVEPPRKPPPPPSSQPATAGEDVEDDDETPAFDGPSAAASSQDHVQPSTKLPVPVPAEPVTALDHYEKAVEREVAGNLGDSLKLYRKAYRLDDRVDQVYRNKHFPKPVPPAPGQAAPALAPTAAAHQPQPMKDLIASFTSMAIEPAAPEIEGMPQRPCPVASLPDEILVHVLRDVAVLDVGLFVRLAQVCKRFAYLVATEDSIWRRVCLGSEFGFGGMHYHWQRQITWEPLTEEDVIREAEAKGDDGEGGNSVDVTTPPPWSLEERAQRHAEESAAATMVFFGSLYGSSWQRMFRLRPRVRFNGCYISTVNYMRPGQASANYVTWHSPVHIVTYYRYLRFFHDGSALSLLTTAEPTDVVHHLTREAVALQAGAGSRGAGASHHLPSAVVQSALRGRWRLTTAADRPTASLSEVEGDLIVETEGVGKYIYRLDLALRSSSPAKSSAAGAKNNKLVWRGFYSYNRLTDDWAEFALKNDKPFFFSRVKSYGVKGG
ncbi:hypothetical protein B0T24DRAFT_59601 [Lasiosphaeria ovina]|uniref:F-box domain-containing protein n=1 Tax=Lasiosphaeria ovina TaxID=92902 RepID=A0AAE0NLD8_9PEZI|nr:hypothetical protein B0T24DRAFT_59601 [Lasiosphaeria ovina]